MLQSYHRRLMAPIVGQDSQEMSCFEPVDFVEPCPDTSVLGFSFLRVFGPRGED
jgi:hypothetical protein